MESGTEVERERGASQNERNSLTFFPFRSSFGTSSVPPTPPVKRGRGPFKARPSLPQNFPVSALFDPGRPARLAAELVGDRAAGSGRAAGGPEDRTSPRRREGGGLVAGAAGMGATRCTGRAWSASGSLYTGSRRLQSLRPSEGRPGRGRGRGGDRPLPSPTISSDVGVGPRPSAGAARPSAARHLLRHGAPHVGSASFGVCSVNRVQVRLDHQTPPNFFSN